MTEVSPEARTALLTELSDEMGRAAAKFGLQTGVPDGTGLPGDREDALAAQARTDAAFHSSQGTWRHVLLEEVLEAFAEADPRALRAELVQVGAVAARWIEALDHRPAHQPVFEDDSDGTISAACSCGEWVRGLDMETATTWVSKHRST